MFDHGPFMRSGFAMEWMAGGGAPGGPSTSAGSSGDALPASWLAGCRPRRRSTWATTALSRCTGTSSGLTASREVAVSGAGHAPERQAALCLRHPRECAGQRLSPQGGRKPTRRVMQTAKKICRFIGHWLCAARNSALTSRMAESFDVEDAGEAGLRRNGRAMSGRHGRGRGRPMRRRHRRRGVCAGSRHP